MYNSILYPMVDDEAQANENGMYIALCLGLTVTSKSVL
jgi:hypothetical protein